MEKQREVTEVADNRGNYFDFFFLHVVAPYYTEVYTQKYFVVAFCLIFLILCLHKTSRLQFIIEDRLLNSIIKMRMAYKSCVRDSLVISVLKELKKMFCTNFLKKKN